MFRTFVAFVLAAAATLATAQDFPSRPISIIVPVPPGGIVDMAARLAGEPLTQALGQSVIVENRAGASGNIAYGMVAAAKPDGYTLLASYSMYHVGNPSMFSGLRWNADSFKPVGMIAVAPNVVVVHPSLPVTSLKELVDYARKNPGKLNYASQGSGSIPHVGTELFKQMNGVDMVHVPYKGSGPAIQDVLSGQVQLFDARSRKRAVIKAFTWRFTGSLDTFLLSSLVLSQAVENVLESAFKIAGGEAASEIVLYYIHERVWNRIAWGRTPTDDVEPAPSAAA